MQLICMHIIFVDVRGHLFAYPNAWIGPKNLLCYRFARNKNMCVFIQLRSIYTKLRHWMCKRDALSHSPAMNAFHCVRFYSMFSFIRPFAIYWINSKRRSPVQCIIYIVYCVLPRIRIQFVYIDFVYVHIMLVLHFEMLRVIYIVQHRMLKFTWNCYFANLAIPRKKFRFQ